MWSLFHLADFPISVQTAKIEKLISLHFPHPLSGILEIYGRRRKERFSQNPTTTNTDCLLQFSCDNMAARPHSPVLLLLPALLLCCVTPALAAGDVTGGMSDVVELTHADNKTHCAGLCAKKTYCQHSVFDASRDLCYMTEHVTAHLAHLPDDLINATHVAAGLNFREEEFVFLSKQHESLMSCDAAGHCSNGDPDYNPAYPSKEKTSINQRQFLVEGSANRDVNNGLIQEFQYEKTYSDTQLYIHFSSTFLGPYSAAGCMRWYIMVNGAECQPERVEFVWHNSEPRTYSRPGAGVGVCSMVEAGPATIGLYVGECADGAAVPVRAGQYNTPVRIIVEELTAHYGIHLSLCSGASSSVTTMTVQGRTASHSLPVKTDQDGVLWARLGVQGQTWSAVDVSPADAVAFTFLSAADVAAVTDLDFADYDVDTDLDLKYQADNSLNPSSVTVWYPAVDSQVTIVMDNGGDHTTVQMADDKHLVCINHSADHRCGVGGKPAAGQTSRPLILFSALMDPQGSGASAHLDEWNRNKYTVTGTRYLVWLKLGKCPFSEDALSPQYPYFNTFFYTRVFNDARQRDENPIIWTVTYHKRAAASGLFVLWSGILKNSGAGYRTPCYGIWYLEINGVQCMNPGRIDGAIYLSADTVWDAWKTAQIGGICEDIGAGEVTISLRLGAGTSDAVACNSDTGANRASHWIVREVNTATSFTTMKTEDNSDTSVFNVRANHWHGLHAEVDGIFDRSHSYYAKKSRTSSVLVLVIADLRAYVNGVSKSCCQWEVLFNGSTCAHPQPITGVTHYEEGASTYFNQPHIAYVEGICDNLPAGLAEVALHVKSCAGVTSRCHVGWQSSMKIILNEVPGQDVGVAAVACDVPPVFNIAHLPVKTTITHYDPQGTENENAFETDRGFVMSARYHKRRSDSSLHIRWNGVVGACRNRPSSQHCCQKYSVRIQNKECTSPSSIEAVYWYKYGSSAEIELSFHQPAVIEGICGNVAAGPLSLSVHVRPCENTQFDYDVWVDNSMCGFETCGFIVNEVMLGPPVQQCSTFPVSNIQYYTQQTNTGEDSVEGLMTVTYNKVSEASLLHVTFVDVFGAALGAKCSRLYVKVDGAPCTPSDVDFITRLSAGSLGAYVLLPAKLEGYCEATAGVHMLTINVGPCLLSYDLGNSHTGRAYDAKLIVEEVFTGSTVENDFIVGSRLDKLPVYNLQYWVKPLTEACVGTDEGILWSETYNKIAEFSDLWITYKGTMRCMSVNGCCRFSLLIDGAECADPMPISVVHRHYHSSVTSDTHRTGTLDGICRYKQSGAVSIQLQVGACLGYAVGNACSFWGGTNLLSVREINQDV